MGHGVMYSCALAHQENKMLFRAEDSTESWKAYVDYIDDKLLEGFFKVIHVSLQFLSSNMHAEV